MKKVAAEYVDATGEDIVCEDGTSFGRNKPKSERKAKADLYQIEVK
jgi:hypothetical protein